MFDERERRYLSSARVGRLATADADGHPHVVPVCFAVHEDTVVTPIDEKPKTAAPSALQRSRDISANPRVGLLVDHYTETWSRLGWLQVRGSTDHVAPGDDDHAPAVTALREKYDQYAEHALEERPLIRLRPDRVLSWGVLERPADQRS